MEHKSKHVIVFVILFSLVVNVFLFPLSASALVIYPKDDFSRYMIPQKDLTPVEESRLFILNVTESKEFYERNPACGIFGHGLKAIKAFGVLCRVGGPALKWVLRPFSVAKSKAIHQNLGKVATACEKIHSATRGVLINTLVKLGVQKKTAEAITEIIFWII